MSFLRHLTEKPWIEQADPPALKAAGAAGARTSASVAVNIILTVASVLFLLLLMAYAMRMAQVDWRPAPQPGLLWQNTIALILASIAIETARRAADQDQIEWARLAMLGAGAFTATFITGQILAWRELDALPLFGVTNPAIAFFYLITGLHALHVAGGLVAWGWVLDRLWRGAEPDAMRRSLQLCARYWHFLLIVWLVLFGLLFSGNDNLNILLSICGLK